ncbi:MAG: sulfatase-like hydrolase/transferase [Planctomycetaceae bacterium]|nr:sulfatase-like hydrolase/transferase [Planctomycetales bacterium]MCB9927468.1 sulfatase-like hydrolase/transferase [Planctomycetaceae bacterium]
MNTVSRRTCTLIAASIAVICLRAPSTSATDHDRPNILFIMTDQHRWDCLGANGNALIKTPNLDRLAAGGANFTHFFVQAPVCVPSRASFFTGRYPHSHRNRVNYTPLNRDEVLMQSRLRDAGYATASVGKLHYYPPTTLEAKRTGFDFVELHDAVAPLDRFSDYVAWRKQHDPQAALSYRALAKNIPTGKNPFRQAIDQKYSETTWVGQRTRHYLRELAAGDKPFFLFSSFWKPHSPFEVPQPYDALYDDIEIPLPAQMTMDQIMALPTPLRTLILRFRPSYDIDREQLQWMYRSYYGAISHIDHEVGLILKELEATGVADNTIVVFSSDHGDQLLEHGLMGKNCFFEASVRVPFIIRFPGRVRAEQHAELVESVDLLPTLFELAGIPEPYLNQGRSLVALIADAKGSYQPREAVFSENVIPEVIAGGKESFEFIKGEGIRGTRHPDAKMVRTRCWKYVYYPDGFEELYDLETDANEMTNLASDLQHRDRIYEMKDRLLHWLTTADEADQIAPRWLRPEP